MSKQSVKFLVAIFLLVFVFSFYYFNISFSSPQNFSEFVEERSTTENIADVESIGIKRTEWLENGVIVGAEDDREFTIDDAVEINSFWNRDVSVHDGGRVNRDVENEFEVYLYFNNGEFQRFHVGEKYIIAREASNTEEHIPLTIKSDSNYLYNYLKGLYE
ncbi:hypothetical protein AJ85_19610 [Alkalihalobacillus alcalophilus ATCC 27647 = CGMCC 1.3604]|uniref:Uncharacterized protein n=1 Tax=Alkalihalobacillus alcalophilus ATCC 27647 = CGMCC 1.3604 TaxID=1218173 RepID=A0A094WGN4_ALKAL|nr:hypothetical protein [Alkalihalobacillus alcalophilus]KGA95946.1 hypothetical protein BALCAV_0219225 [Alkalihalobacillus alcalophilus ATCC 27647 = CGMCC 1.3604]MED1561764.1 hypothetical protein [Alkalihalobacillus alcalophilus]THG89088.1 hypothetical protein AJ85_19610 [Alkalihalobacillus alcalophilus ATCC 27647 = CGMCC 1.3604]